MNDSEINDVLYWVLEEDSSSSSSSSSSSTTSSSDMLSCCDTGIDDIERRSRCRITNYIENFVNSYDEIEFKKHFRMSRHTTEFWIDQLASANILSTNSVGREKVSPKKAFLMTLWYLSNQETYRQISDRFDVAESCSLIIIRNVVNYIVSVSPTYIKWPTQEQQVEISDEFQKKQGLKGVVGAIDGSHILINRPKNDQDVYCNRKGTHSILLQGVVDHRRIFIDVFCGEPGSTHDARLLKKSSLYELGINGALGIGNNYILGDSAYPKLPWLIPPFKDNGQLSEEERIYNFKHSSTRIVVENAFGLLKGRFRRLRHFDNRNINFITNCVVAACTLHNICITMGNSDEGIDCNQSDSE